MALNVGPKLLQMPRGIESKKTLARIATAQRINQASDDASGLAQATRMDSDLREYAQSVRNASDAISLAQTADAGTAAVAENVDRIRELAVQAANDTLTTDDRESIQAEINALGGAIDHTVSTTQFNGQPLLDGTFAGRRFTVGGDTPQLTLGDVSATALSLGSIDVSSAASARTAIEVADVATAKAGEVRSKAGTFTRAVEASISNMRSSAESSAAARSRIMDADVAKETAELTRRQILSQSATASHVHANASEKLVLEILGPS